MQDAPLDLPCYVADREIQEQTRGVLRQCGHPEQREVVVELGMMREAVALRDLSRQGRRDRPLRATLQTPME